MSNEEQSVENQVNNDAAAIEGIIVEEEIETGITDDETVVTSNISVELLQQQLAVSEKKATENLDKALRVQAEMENLKRRTQKDLDGAHKFGLEKIAKELLGVVDSLELGIQAATSDIPEVLSLKEGAELTVKQFEAVFAKFNIAAIDPMGEAFNPEFHQAMSMVPAGDAAPNTVINVFQKGYVLNGRLIRPAMVVVTQASAKVDIQA